MTRTHRCSPSLALPLCSRRPPRLLVLPINRSSESKEGGGGSGTLDPRKISLVEQSRRRAGEADWEKGIKSRHRHLGVVATDDDDDDEEEKGKARDDETSKKSGEPLHPCAPSMRASEEEKERKACID